MREIESLALQEKVSELPDVFADFWQDWYRISEQYAHDLPGLLACLEKLLFESDEELLTHDLAVVLCRALRFWRLQARRVLAEGKIGLQELIRIWELFQRNFIPRIRSHTSILVKAAAVPYSFAGLSIMETAEDAQHPRYSSGQIGLGALEHSDLLKARFQKTLGYLAQAEKRLQELSKNSTQILPTLKLDENNIS